MRLFVFFFFKQKTAYEMLRSLVGSEMCIRDRAENENAHVYDAQREMLQWKSKHKAAKKESKHIMRATGLGQLGLVLVRIARGNMAALLATWRAKMTTAVRMELYEHMTKLHRLSQDEGRRDDSVGRDESLRESAAELDKVREQLRQEVSARQMADAGQKRAQSLVVSVSRDLREARASAVAAKHMRAGAPFHELPLIVANVPPGGTSEDLDRLAHAQMIGEMVMASESTAWPPEGHCAVDAHSSLSKVSSPLSVERLSHYELLVRHRRMESELEQTRWQLDRARCQLQEVVAPVQTVEAVSEWREMDNACVDPVELQVALGEARAWQTKAESTIQELMAGWADEKDLHATTKLQYQLVSERLTKIEHDVMVRDQPLAAMASPGKLAPMIRQYLN
eukprot:TRINITY_DN44223_c0_g1_i2.p1 TRINITY_DN44223_c0_g1~~TRINITY_DN44223_c0_g1_i2.p1  ORF type:complete len:395 (+),score=101.50 TRINITY_DN44223_c0_g1_i2:93-1277(+)